MFASKHLTSNVLPHTSKHTKKHVFPNYFSIKKKNPWLEEICKNRSLQKMRPRVLVPSSGSERMGNDYYKFSSKNSLGNQPSLNGVIGRSMVSIYINYRNITLDIYLIEENVVFSYPNRGILLVVCAIW